MDPQLVHVVFHIFGYPVTEGNIVGALFLWLVGSIAGGMPSPNGTSPTNTLWYRWLFASVHIFSGGIFRFVAIFLPEFGKKIGIILPGTYNVNETQRKSLTNGDTSK